jgi:hypothetical protein
MVGSPNDETAGGSDNGAVFVYDEKSYIERKNYIGLRCPVMFQASSQGIDYAGGSGSSATIIKWNIVYRNWGGGYDPKTGIFTAPIAGYYKFDTFLNSADVGVHWFRFAWFKNGNIYHPHYQPGAYEDDHKSISGSIVVDLEVGDHSMFVLLTTRCSPAMEMDLRVFIYHLRVYGTCPIDRTSCKGIDAPR